MTIRSKCVLVTALLVASLRGLGHAGSGVQLIGVDPASWNPLRPPMRIQVRSARFRAQADGAIFNEAAGSQLIVTINGEEPKLRLVSSDTVSLGPSFQEGKNAVVIMAAGEYAPDPKAETGYLEAVLYAGTRALEFQVLDENGRATDRASVTLQLGDSEGFAVERRPRKGRVHFENLSSEGTFFATARDKRNYMSFPEQISMPSFAGGVPALRLRGFDAPSNIDNNAFSKGSEGWNADSGKVKIIPHKE